LPKTFILPPGGYHLISGKIFPINGDLILTN
jgi:hypothetical protein